LNHIKIKLKNDYDYSFFGLYEASSFDLTLFFVSKDDISSSVYTMQKMITIQENISLQPFNTFGIAARARFFVDINTIEELQELLSDEKWKNTEKLILGGGSNVLFTQDFAGLVLKISIKGQAETKRNEQLRAVIVEVGAGENWHEFVQWTLEQDFGGLENLSLIPGTVGAAPVQNIGAYGVELKDRFISLTAIEIETGHIKTFMRDEIEFGYRDSIFKQSSKGKYIIANVRFALTTAAHELRTEYGVIKKELDIMSAEPNIKNIAQAIINIRRQKLPDPAEIGNGGSFFKNPIIPAEEYDLLQSQFIGLPAYEIREPAVVTDSAAVIEDLPEDVFYKIPAGWLIDQCGWKGYRREDAGVHENQALVLVNHGKATGAEILALAADIQSNVYETFGLSLEREIQVV
jgi:UDP-N-acetylmuramate dehydrogenase